MEKPDIITMRVSRITDDLPEYRRGKSIEMTIDGVKVRTYEGDLVSTVLLAEGISTFRHKHLTGRPSGLYCGIGVCNERLVTITGTKNIRTCQTYAANQMAITTDSSANS